MKRKRLGKKGTVTGFQLVVSSLTYFLGIFLLFLFMPDGTGITSTSGAFGDSSAQTVDNVSEVDIPESSGIIGLLLDVVTFDIIGIPTWFRFIAVFFPSVILILGIYGMVRGI